MKLSIKTSQLQDLVARSMRCANSKTTLPLTSLMAIELKDNTLTLTTTDGANYLYVRADKIVGDNFYVVAPAELFSKLIARLTCETVTLEKTDNALNVTGNGNYSIELPLNEEGEPVIYPDPLAKDFVPIEGCEVNLSTIKLALNTAKPALTTFVETDRIPDCYTGYYIKDSIIATNTFKICGIDVNMWDTPALIHPDMLDLLNVFTEEKVQMQRDDSIMVLSTSNCTVYGPLMSSIADFQIDAINGLLCEPFDSHCVIVKDSMLQLLDRLSLFVNNLDDDGRIYLTFTGEGIQVESKLANSVEIIPYAESSNFKPYTCCIDLEMLRVQFKANAGDRIKLSYGKDNAIKLSDGAVTQIIALIEDVRG